MNNHPPEAAAFIPMLYLQDLSKAIEFYKKAFRATERWRIRNADGSTHVAEIEIPPVLLRLHEEVSRHGVLGPSTVKATTVVIGLLVQDPDGVMAKSVAAGAQEISAMRDYEYGFRQGTIVDPFGHQWCIERMDDFRKVPTM